MKARRDRSEDVADVAHLGFGNAQIEWLLDEPNSAVYTGGKIAAPVFARSMQHALAVERVPAGS